MFDFTIPYSRIYRNDAGSFVDTGAPLVADFEAHGAWGDYDNDGDLDVLLGTCYSCNVYRNDDGAFVDIEADLPALDTHGDLQWGDYDNDGDLDILMMRQEYPLRGVFIYRNDAGVFTDAEAGLPDVYYGEAAWADYDGDGDLDVAAAGEDTDSVRRSHVLRNDAGSFVDIGANLVGVSPSSVAWGDYDNDGDLDLLLAGRNSSDEYLTRLYRNDTGTFVDSGAELPGLYSSRVAWADFNNDGKLDILIAGGYSSDYSRIFRNRTVNNNTPPSPPGNLQSQLVGNQLTMSWDAAVDAQTPSPGLSYNVMVGTTPGGWEICSPLSDPAGGYRRVVGLGNAQMRTSWTLTMPDATGPYYWGVQAIDGAYVGSAFAAGAPVPAAAGQEDLPLASALYSAVPNPFNPSTTIAFDLWAPSEVKLHIYDVSGRLVRKLIDRVEMEAGHSEVVWTGKDQSGRQLASGAYFYRLEAGGYVETKRMTLLK